MNPFLNRRRFLTRTSCGLGMAAVSGLLNEGIAIGGGPVTVPGTLGKTHHEPKAKAVIHLFMAGGPSHVDTFDYKPKLKEDHGKDVPKTILGEQRVTLMTRNQGHFKTASTPFTWKQHGQSGQWVSEVLPNLAGVADELCVIRSLHSEPINHDPAVTFMQTGRPQPGLPCAGSWASYGLGSESKDLPAYVVMLSGPFDQPIPSRYFHSGFLPSQHQGVQFLSGNDPVLYLSNPAGMPTDVRSDLVGGISELNKLRQQTVGDPDIEARINSFELAFRMQSSVPELMDISKETKETTELYGPELKTPGSFARHCLLARRLVQRGVRYVQLFHRGWDQHGDVTGGVRRQAKATDQPAAALIKDLKRLGMLDSTLVIWGGEFGRTAYGQGDLKGGFGRDHHPRSFSAWMAGGGIKKGVSYGKTDDYGYNVAENPLHVNDFHATILHLLGVDHERLTYKFGGRNFRLTDVAGKVVKDLLA